MRRWPKGIGIAVTVALLVLPGARAGAELGDPPPTETHYPAGKGQLAGTELVEEQGPLPCFRATRTLFGLRGAGTFEGRTTTGDPVIYNAQVVTGQTLYGNGPLQVQLENTEVYYHSPFGTHGTETGGGAGCNPDTAGTPVPAEFRIFAADGGIDTDGDSDVDILTGNASVYRLNGTDKVPCVGMGSFGRGSATSSGVWRAEWTLSADCIVVGNPAGTPGTGTAPRGTFMTDHGTHLPCFNGPCTDNVTIDYQQYLPRPGPYLRLSGPDSATVGCDGPVAVTARLTDTGWPAAGVAVSFSVAGPGPAVPPSGSATTDANGSAAFSFSAAVNGDYTVTATATVAAKLVSATHVVRFGNPPPPSITLASASNRWQTEEQVSVTATVDDACGPLPGATVDFSVAWPSQAAPWTGQATPASGSAVTDADGRATFGFSGDRAGDYRVTATTQLPTGEQPSAARTLHLDIRDFKRAGALSVPVPGDFSGMEAAVMDLAGHYAYFGATNGTVEKIDLTTFQLVGELTLVDPGTGFRNLTSAALDPAGRFAYFGDGSGTVFKVDLETFVQAGVLQAGATNESFASVVIDPAGRFAYFGTGSSPLAGRIVKVDLATFTTAGTIAAQIGDQSYGTVESAVMDPAGRYAYFGTRDSSTGRIVKVDLATFQITQTLTLANREVRPTSAIVDPAGDFAYLSIPGSPGSPGSVVKINLRTFERVGAVTLLPGETFSIYAKGVIDPTGAFAYFVANQDPDADTQLMPAAVVKIDLRTFERAHAITLEPGPDSPENDLRSAVIDPAGNFAYFGTEAQGNVKQRLATERVVKVQLRRPPSPALAADDETYATDFETPLTVPAPGVLDGDSDAADGDPLVAGQASDPAGGSVVLNPDGGFTYTPDPLFAGTDTFTYTASDGMGYSAPATVSVTVAPPQGLTGAAFGYYTDVSLFGGPAERRGFGQPAAAPATAASPSVSLPEDASPTTAHDANGAMAQYGPAVIFGGISSDDVAADPPSGPLTATTEGSTTGGWVKSSAKVELHPAPVAVRCEGDPAGTANCTVPGGMGPGPLVADGASSTCMANRSGVSASASFVNGVVETKYDPDTQLPVESQPIPNPVPVNYTVEGTIDHVGDSFRIVFNEQVVSAGGSIVAVNAAHMYLLGPTAVGDMVIAQSVCGAPPGPNTAPVASDDAYTTVAGTPLTVAAPGVLANDVDADADLLTAGSASDPAGGAVVLNADGSFTYTPDAGFTGTDTFTYTAADGHGGTDTATVTLTVTAANTVSVGDVAVAEGDSGTRAAVFTVSLARPSTSTVSVAYATANGTATAGSDYMSKSGTLSFAPGTTAATVKVPVTGDAVDEADESFTLALSSPTGAALGDATGTGTIVDDDPKTVTGIRLAVGDVAVHEGDSGARSAVFTVSLSKASTATVKVNYATANATATKAGDYTRAAGTLSIAAGATSAVVKVAINPDNATEGNETFAVNLSAPSGATISDASGLGTIIDDD